MSRGRQGSLRDTKKSEVHFLFFFSRLRFIIIHSVQRPFRAHPVYLTQVKFRLAFALHRRGFIVCRATIVIRIRLSTADNLLTSTHYACNERKEVFE